ncbi:hypothetical protein [Sulfurospirillum barnesii]|uniref:Lipoprotein n=1 Tax=Sulfurospirillum barnesii (strain ATCC 700032 / DSM 10660 / SES-3) TaxID=760154 RepID=I3XU54_SULBS|nr:hypothetical protein [Sulfurospirillum barnesii]AFL67478.1 hypothetical protein Sulba_0151 [Sulfurospirillum barnesii SES-3]
MKWFLHVSLSILLFWLSGCALKKEITQSNAYIITIKNKQIALSDTGFINHGNNYDSVQIFSAGNILFHLEIMGNYICMEGKCLERLAFNKRFFETEHYAELMQDIMAQKPIYDGQFLRSTSQGFEQELLLDSSHIIYKVENKTLSFRDTKNNILIRIKPLP